MAERLAIVILCGLMGITGCSSETPVAPKTFPGGRPIKIVATTAMVGDLVRNVGGPHVTVTDLFKPGVDPHTYRPTTEDLRLLQSADMVFYNGLHLEGRMGVVFEKLGQKVPSLGVADILTTKTSDTNANPEGGLLNDGEHPDPHVWFDVRLWQSLIPNVQMRLATFDPARADDYQRFATEYADRLEKLDRETTEQMRSIPKDKRVLVTSHDAFRYFGRAYDVDVRGIQGVNTETEASVGHISELVEFLSKAKIKSVFVESSVNPRNMSAVIEGCRARGHDVALGGELFSDAMGEPGTPEGTYEGMIRHNVATLVKALK